MGIRGGENRQYISQSIWTNIKKWKGKKQYRSTLWPAMWKTSDNLTNKGKKKEHERERERGENGGEKTDK